MELSQQLEEVPWVQFAYLFGSRARGQHRPDSDVDLAVAISDAPPDAYRQLVRRLSVDGDLHLTLLHEAPPLLRYNVLRDGKLVFERDAAARIRFQVRTMSEYLDMLPGQERLVQAQKARLKAGNYSDGRSYDVVAASRRLKGLLGEAPQLPERT